MKPETYAEEFKKVMGKERALKIAERCYKDTVPENWNSVPEGEVFYDRNRQNKLVINTKRLKSTHNWWKHVYFILKKQ